MIAPYRTRQEKAPALYWFSDMNQENAMQDPAVESGTVVRPSESAPDAGGEEPQRRQRERSGILGEPAGIPPASEGTSDGSERGDPIHEQVPQDGDHWRR